MSVTLEGLLELLKQFGTYQTTGAVSIPLSGAVNGALKLTRDAQGRTQFALEVKF